MIEILLTEIGIKFNIRVDEAFASCPSHHDSGDSWSINLDTGLYHCFACGFSGNLPALVSFMLGLSYAEAVAWVISRTGMSKARQWLESKGSLPQTELRLTDADLALFMSPPQFALDSRKINEESASKYEVLWNTDRGSWIFPIRSAKDFSLMGWQEKNNRKFRNYPVNCKKSETLFGIRTITDGGTVILVESPVDAVRCLSSGAGTGLSSFGVSVSNKQLGLIRDVADRLILALDNDTYGMAETYRICREFKQLPVRVFDYGTNDVKDIGELTDEQIRWGVDHAIPRVYFR
jgi:DNA primase